MSTEFRTAARLRVVQEVFFDCMSNHSEPSPLLKLSGIEVRSSSGERILDELTFELRPGEIVGMLGESGSGKTTTALSILRLLPPGSFCAKGRIEFQGKNLLELSEDEMRRVRGAQISLVFQEPGLALSPVMTAGAQVVEVMRAHLPWSRERCRRETEELLERLEFKDARRIFRAYPHQLSGGECQRVLIAQALACGPRLVIADEPTASLDASTQAEIMNLLRELHRQYGLAMLFITHAPALLVDFVDRVLVIEHGKVIEEGPLQAIFEKPRQVFTRALVETAQRRALGCI